MEGRAVKRRKVVDVVHHEPVIENRVPRVEERHPADDPRFWPASKPLPTAYVRPPIPCPSCRRLLTDNGGRAARVTKTNEDGSVVSFACNVCGARWKLPKVVA